VKLSIIIVNYNVRYFLEHCLHSVIKAVDESMEILVIDNASTDGSREMMAERFPDIHYDYQEINHGFSKANNIGIKKAKGEYVVLLNPDTVVKEDTFIKCIQFMDEHIDCGGLGIHMIDGAGKFLPESKRGLPTPSAAFYKIFGLSGLFPKSKRFGKYHLGYLPEFETNEIEVLSGAYMMMRQSALEKCGFLDEEYFMYGEDIDLSYRITKSGFKNYYFPEAQIIHYKGESTKKGSVNYVFVFYRAMIIFARKHFEKGQASLFGALINAAIYFRAFLALLSRLFGKTWQMLVDLIIAYTSFYLVTRFYEEFQSKDFSLPFVSVALPAYAIIMVLTLVFSGAYDKPFKSQKMVKGWLVSTLVLLAVYALLPESYRFSRAVILIGSSTALIAGFIWRIVLTQFSSIKGQIAPKINTRRLVVGDEFGLHQVKSFIEKEALESDFIAGVLPKALHPMPLGFVGERSRLKACIKIFKIDEVVFCSDCLSNKDILEEMNLLKNQGIEMMIALPNVEFLIGSQRVIKPHGNALTHGLRSINLTAIERNKRLVDVLFALTSIISLPLTLLLVDEKLGLVKNIFSVLKGKKSWVGLDQRGLSQDFPKLKQGVIHPLINVIISSEKKNLSLSENVSYLKNYSVISDFKLILTHFQLLGN
jgi:O-antigen biosynthesis protein